MAYGKGPFTIQDKILPGMYVNLKGEAQSGSDMGSRGKAAVALNLDWGNDSSEIFKVTATEFYSECRKIFGYNYSDDAMLALRQIFLGASEVYVYRLNVSGGVKASASNFANAKYIGTRGNNISVTVSVNVDDSTKFDVVTLFDNMTVDRQMGVTADTLEDNDYVSFIKGDDFSLSEGTQVLSGGSNGSGGLVANHNDFLSKLEAYEVNAVGYIYDDASIASIYASWAKVQRDVYGNCIQAVLYDQPADHVAVINVDDSVALVPWVLGKSVGCALNASLQNIKYDGEVKPSKSYTQVELEKAIQNGKFVLHRVGDEFKVLADINSLVNPNADQNEEFKLNQVIRVIDQINLDACDIWCEDFIGKVPNTDNGRNLFWSRIISLLNDYVAVGAIEEYDKDMVTIAAGTQRGSVVMQIPVQVATMLEKAYVTIVVQ